MYLHTETDRYRLSSDRMSFFELRRLSDDASAYFQGDDAALWRRNMDWLESTHEGSPETFERAFHGLCESYDLVLDDRGY